MRINDLLKNERIILDGGMGTLLQQKGLQPGEAPEMWNLTHPDIIMSIHKDYLEAGSQVISTNTFGANCLKYNEVTLRKIIFAAVENARNACYVREESYVALDIGPTGKLLKPFGDLDFEEAVNVFAQTVKLGVEAGVDLVFIETMNDGYETKAALLAAKENSHLPVFVSNAYGTDGKLMNGATPEVMVAMLEGLGADAIGVNCSFGPDKLAPVVEKYLSLSSLPVLLKPNAGMPHVENGKTLFDFSSENFAKTVAKLVDKGVRIVGGCCGTTPEYIKAVCNEIKNTPVKPIETKNTSCVSSYSHTISFDKKPVLIGERINPTGKKRFRQALIENDINYILNEAVAEQDAGSDILDVNVGIPDINEKELLPRVVSSLCAVTDLPLQIDTSDAVAMEKALRVYNGKALINSVNGKAESMKEVFPLVKKYGGMVIALTLDEDGIPDTVQGRVRIAKKILQQAKKYGIEKKDIIFDTLTMTVSADRNAARTTLQSAKALHDAGCLTSLGVSNVSFGLPDRDSVNASFFTLALENGLNAAIMNPFSDAMLKAYHTFCLLKGLDENGLSYISFCKKHSADATESTAAVSYDLKTAVIKGLKEKASSLTKQMVSTQNPLSVITEHVIPALDEIGKGYENKIVYLPQLLMSAEAAKASFEVIKTLVPANSSDKEIVCLATVQGDIHDIGKNIVKLLLENYGFSVIDLGKDVTPEKIVEAVTEKHIQLVGLSALMTTTVPSMEKTIRLLHQSAPWCKTVVGGAVLTPEYADKIGADYYAKDATETVRVAKEVFQWS